MPTKDWGTGAIITGDKQTHDRLIFCYEIWGLEIRIAEGETITGYTIKEGGKILPAPDSIFNMPYAFHSIFGSKGTIWDRGMPPWKPYGHKTERSIERAKEKHERRKRKRRETHPWGRRKGQGRHLGRREND